jgi:hypothetical protein
MKWTKLDVDLAGSEGLSSLDVPWLGSIAEADGVATLFIRYLGVEDSGRRIWRDAEAKEGERMVTFAGSPSRILEVSFPASLIDSEGSEAAVNETLQHYFSTVRMSPETKEKWERIFASAAGRLPGKVSATGGSID